MAPKSITMYSERLHGQLKQVLLRNAQLSVPNSVLIPVYMQHQITERKTSLSPTLGGDMCSFGRIIQPLFG